MVSVPRDRRSRGSAEEMAIANLEGHTLNSDEIVPGSAVWLKDGGCLVSTTWNNSFPVLLTAAQARELELRR